MINSQSLFQVIDYVTNTDSVKGKNCNTIQRTSSSVKPDTNLTLFVSGSTSTKLKKSDMELQVPYPSTKPFVPTLEIICLR